MTADRGSGTVWMLGLSLILVLVVAVGLATGSAVVARHRAEAAADFAALAGALAAARYEPAPCRAAADLAKRNGGSLTACTVTGAVVDVSVSIRVRVGRLGTGTAVGRARAGPVTSG